MAQGNIAQYNSPVDKLTPEDHGMDAMARAGRTIGGLGHETGELYQRTIDQVGGQAAKIIDDHEYASEVSQGSAVLAAMHNNFTTQWNEMASKTDPNDKSIQGKFLDQTVEPQLQSFQDSFSTDRGQQWAMNAADQMRMHYTEKTTADMSTRAGNAFIEDLKTQSNQLSSAAHDDHTSIDQSLNQVDNYIAAQKDAHASLLGPEALNKIDDVSHDIKNEIVKSGIQGWIDKNPQQGMAAVNGGVYDKYISGTEKDQFTRYAETQMRAKMEDQNLAYTMQERAQKQQEEAAANKLLNDSYDPKTGTFNFGAGTIQQIASNQQLSAKAKVDMISSIKKISTDTSFNDPSTIQDFSQRLGSTDNPLTHQDLLEAMGQGKLDFNGYTTLNGMLKNTPDAVAEKGAFTNALSQAQKTILTPAGPGAPVTPDQRQKETEFTNWFLSAYQNGMNDPQFKGMSQSQKAQVLLSTTDPKGLLNPDNMKRFMSTPQQMLQDGMKAVGPLPSGLGAPDGIKITAPSASDIAYLKANPNMKAQYDRQFGAGAADKVLGSK